MAALQASLLSGRWWPGATRSASLRACPWLPYLAPLALCR